MLQIRNPYQEIGELLAPVYEEMGWEWAGTDGPPDAEAIAAQVHNLVHQVDKGAISASTGGLTVERDDDRLIVSFEIASVSR